MRRDHLNPDTLPRTNGYSHVVEAKGGRTIYISGQIAFDRAGKLVGDGDFAAQAQQVFENLSAALAAANAELADVVKITIFMTDLRHLATLREVRDRYFTKDFPASSLVQVSALVHPALMVEIEAIAVAI
jgi:reactive intermediate/imine deaminase